jgi:hypothetical protein
MLHIAKRAIPAVLLSFSSAALAGPASLRPLMAGDAEGPAHYFLGEQKACVRSRFVTLDLTGLRPVDQRGAVTLGLNLFDDVNFTAVLTRSEPGATQGTVWIGHLEGLEGISGVIVSRIADEVYIDVWTTDAGTFTVRSSGQPGVHAVLQMDPSLLLPCGVGPQHIISTLEPAEDEGQGAPRDTGDLIDLLVMYTVGARNAAGGTTAINNAMNGWITYTNQAYINSQMVQRVRLVHIVETTYVEASAGAGGMDTDLTRFRATNDGQMDNVHTLRNTFGADMCELVSLSTGACGLAFLMSPESAGFHSQAFGVTNLGCGASTFAHEVGHGMGCAHDHQNGSVGAFCYSFGYRTQPNGGWRTIMAYEPGNQIQFFSNPNINFQGVPIGIAQVPGCNNATAADNARSMNETRDTVANFRQQQVGNPPPAAFNLMMPSDGAVGVNLTPILSWAASEFANEYDVTISTEADMTPVVWEITVANTQAVVPPATLENCTQYFWSVVAVGFGGQTLASSAPYDFTTALVGDIDGNGAVEFPDLNFLLFQYGEVGANAADLDDDNDVDFADLNLLLSNYNLSC